MHISVKDKKGRPNVKFDTVTCIVMSTSTQAMATCTVVMIIIIIWLHVLFLLLQALFREGAILAFLGVPEGTEFGIDYNCWRVGHKFKGVKMIPPGIHFVYYR